MQRAMTTAIERFIFSARLGMSCIGHGPAALAKIETALAHESPDWQTDNSDAMAFALTAPGPATSLLVSLWGLQRGGPGHALAAIAGYLVPGTLLVVSVLMFLLLMGFVLPSWAAGFGGGLIVAGVLLFGQMLIQRAPHMVQGSLPAVLALLSAAMVWLLPDATGQILALTGCGLMALVLNLSPPEQVSFERRQVFASAQARWIAGVTLTSILVLPWLLGDSAGGWAASLVRSSFLILQNEALLLAALDADLTLEGETLAMAYGVVAGSGAPVSALAAAAGFSSAESLWGGLLLGLIAVVLIHASSLFSIVFLWPEWQKWRQKNGLASVLAGLQAAAFGILLPVILSPLLIAALSGFTSVVLLAAGAFALVRLNAPPWLLAAGLGLISAMAATV